MTNNPGRLAFKGVKLGLRRKNEVADFECKNVVYMLQLKHFHTRLNILGKYA